MHRKRTNNALVRTPAVTDVTRARLSLSNSAARRPARLQVAARYSISCSISKNAVPSSSLCSGSRPSRCGTSLREYLRSSIPLIWPVPLAEHSFRRLSCIATGFEIDCGVRRSAAQQPFRRSLVLACLQRRAARVTVPHFTPACVRPLP